MSTSLISNPPKIATREGLLNTVEQLIEKYPRWELIDHVSTLEGVLERDGFEPWSSADLKAVVREALQGKPSPAQEPEAEPAPSDEAPEECDLLPFPNMPLRSGGEPVAITGYLIDRWCRPHGTGARRKGGPLDHRHYWEDTRKGKRFRAGYRITIGKKRMFRQDWWFALARHKAEQLRRQGQENATWDD